MKTPDNTPQPQTAREARLAEALRANLRRRKVAGAPASTPTSKPATETAE